MPPAADPGLSLPKSAPRLTLVYSRPMTLLANIRNAAQPLREAVPPLLAALGLTLLYQATAPLIEVSASGNLHRVRTLAPTVAGVLRHADLEAAASDRVVPAADQSARQVDQVQLERSQSVRLDLAGDSQLVHTTQEHPANILAQAGIRLLPGDRVYADGLPLEAWPSSGADAPSRIRLERGERPRVRVDGSTQAVSAHAATWAEALWRAGIALRQGDEFSASWVAQPDSRSPQLRTGSPVAIEVDGETIRATVAASNVAQALAKAGIVLMGLDRTRPELEAPVPSQGPIEVTRVREEVLVELDPVPFETRYDPLPELEIDERRILDTGAYGVQANQVRVRYENGEEVARTVEGNWLAREPEPRVVGYGTNIVVRTLSTPDGTIEYWRAVEMWATSYSASRAGVSPDAPNYGITASGRRLEKGLVAIDRSLIPFGTQMYVPGYGFALAADTGSGVKGRWIDLGYDDDNWVSWAQYVTVYFLTPVPPADNITWILP